MSASYWTPSWHHEAMLDRSQSGRWMLVCTVWIPTGRLTQQTQITGQRKNTGQTKMMSSIASQFSPLLLNISFSFPQVNMFFSFFSSCLYMLFIFFPLPWLYLSFLSRSLISPHPLNFSPGATVCVHSVAAATAGGRTSGRVNKRPRDPHPRRNGGRKAEMERKSNFIFLLGGMACTRREKINIKRQWKGMRWGDGWIV